MKKFDKLFILLVFAIICFFFGIFRVIQSENIFRLTIETVKSQLQQSEKGLVTVTRPDLHLLIIFSVFSLMMGIAIGFLIKPSP